MDDSLLLHLSQWGLLASGPPRDVWSRLSAYESSDLVRGLLNERHHRFPSSGKSLEVAAHMAQGRQYFEAAAGAAELTRPLLLYYGVLSLSRAIILCADVQRREATLSEAHGLSCHGWGGELAGGPSKLPDVKIAVTSGTFTELAVATKNIERSLVFSHHRLRSSLVQEGTSQFGAAKDPVRISLREVLSRIPDLTDMFQVTFSTLSACHPAYVELYNDLQASYYVLPTKVGLPSTANLRQAFQLHPQISIDPSDHYHTVGHVRGLYFYINRETSPPEWPGSVLHVKNDGRTIPYLVEPLTGGINLSSLSLLFLVSFAMGMLVRYHPSQWAMLAGQGRGNAMLPLLSAAARLIEHHFPELVLEEVEQTHPGASTYQRT